MRRDPLTARRDAERDTRLALAVATALTLYALACKLLLFRNLEYTASDLYSCLGMSHSWFYSGRLLHDNAYGDSTAIHAFYLLIAFSPLTLWLGAYGLLLGQGLLQLLAVARAALTPALGPRGRLALLAGLLSPLAFYALDDRGWGFHTELCYPPLAVLLALSLLEGRRAWALIAGAATVLVKEDGALVCAGVLAAYYLGALRAAAAEDRPRVARRALLALGAMGLVFAAGMGLLSWNAHQLASGQTTSGERVARALGILWRTLAPAGPDGRQAALREACAGYAAAALLLLVPLGRRLGRGLVLLALAAPPVLAALVVSDAQYKFLNTLWAPRAATLIGVVLACLAIAAAGEAPASRRPARPGRSAVTTLLLALVSWGLQLALLARLGYSPAPRLDAWALWDGRGYAIASVPRAELARWRCLAGGLPAGLPVEPLPAQYPIFHRQTIVFRTLEANAARPPRLKVVPAAEGYRVLADADLQPALRACGFP